MDGLPVVKEEISLCLPVIVQGNYQSKVVLSAGSGGEGWTLQRDDGASTDVDLKSEGRSEEEEGRLAWYCNCNNAICLTDSLILAGLYLVNPIPVPKTLHYHMKLNDVSEQSPTICIRSIESVNP